ncbi:MAG: class I SAM-dependent methyltransferase [Thiogranum sp.]|nr:class I SAM-dependent methyltransferase [Thiogranum sp.]
MPESPNSIGLLAGQGASRARADAIARQFGFSRLKQPPGAGFYLALGDAGLELRQAGENAPGPIRIDFLGGALGHRLRFGGGRGQPLARAVGMKSGFSPSIWDATAGLGRDALVLASLGSQVTLCERAPVLAALLEDGLQRAALDSDAGDWIQARMRLVYADSRERLAALAAAERPDVVYLDPMYPPGKAGVLVKKEMRALQTLLGREQDAEALLETALGAAQRRVVVKRPGHGEWLAGKKPDTSIASKKTRYDVYVTLI